MWQGIADLKRQSGDKEGGPAEKGSKEKTRGIIDAEEEASRAALERVRQLLGRGRQADNDEEESSEGEEPSDSEESSPDVGEKARADEKAEAAELPSDVAKKLHELLDGAKEAKERIAARKGKKKTRKEELLDAIFNHKKKREQSTAPGDRKYLLALDEQADELESDDDDDDEEVGKSCNSSKGCSAASL